MHIPLRHCWRRVASARARRAYSGLGVNRVAKESSSSVQSRESAGEPLQDRQSRGEGRARWQRSGSCEPDANTACRAHDTSVHPCAVPRPCGRVWVHHEVGVWLSRGGHSEDPWRPPRSRSNRAWAEWRAWRTLDWTSDQRGGMGLERCTEGAIDQAAVERHG